MFVRIIYNTHTLTVYQIYSHIKSSVYDAHHLKSYFDWFWKELTSLLSFKCFYLYSHASRNTVVVLGLFILNLFGDCSGVTDTDLMQLPYHSAFLESCIFFEDVGQIP